MIPVGTKITFTEDIRSPLSESSYMILASKGEEGWIIYHEDQKYVVTSIEYGHWFLVNESQFTVNT